MIKKIKRKKLPNQVWDWEDHNMIIINDIIRKNKRKIEVV
jgi:hypothetical protein